MHFDKPCVAGGRYWRTSSDVDKTSMVLLGIDAQGTGFGSTYRQSRRLNVMRRFFTSDKRASHFVAGVSQRLNKCHFLNWIDAFFKEDIFYYTIEPVLSVRRNMNNNNNDYFLSFSSKFR